MRFPLSTSSNPIGAIQRFMGKYNIDIVIDHVAIEEHIYVSTCTIMRGGFSHTTTGNGTTVRLAKLDVVLALINDMNKDGGKLLIELHKYV